MRLPVGISILRGTIADLSVGKWFRIAGAWARLNKIVVLGSRIADLEDQANASGALLDVGIIDH
jgi:hypothetical protein